MSINHGRFKINYGNLELKNRIKKIIKEETKRLLLENQNYSFVKRGKNATFIDCKFFRLGNPAGINSSMIHGSYEEEWWLHGPDNYRAHQQYESGLSAYPILFFSENKIIVGIPIEMHIFKRQANSLFFDRVFNEDFWVFDGIDSGKRGTDREPLIDPSSVKNIFQISSQKVYVSSIGGDFVKPDEGYGFDIFVPHERSITYLGDVISSRSISSNYDGHVTEIFEDDVTKDGIMKERDRLLSYFKKPEQKEAVSKEFEIMINDWEVEQEKIVNEH